MKDVCMLMKVKVNIENVKLNERLKIKDFSKIENLTLKKTKKLIKNRFSRV